MADVEKLAREIAELRDGEAVKTVMARYCHLVDSRSYAELSELFTEDATCNYGFFGSFKGRKEIIGTFFGTLVDGAASFMVHMVHNPVVEVSGDEASGSWYLTAQTTIQPANRAVWVMGIYRNRFRRVGGAWKICLLDFEFKYYSPYEDGWAKTQIWQIPQ